MVCKYRNTTVSLMKLLFRNISLQSKLKEFCLLYMTRERELQVQLQSQPLVPFQQAENLEFIMYMSISTQLFIILFFFFIMNTNSL